MSKIRPKAIEQALNQAVALRRKVVDCRFPRDLESELLNRTSDLINLIEGEVVMESTGVKEEVETDA